MFLSFMPNLLDLLEHRIRVDGDRLRHIERLVDPYQLVCEFEHVVAKRNDDELTVAGHAGIESFFTCCTVWIPASAAQHSFALVADPFFDVLTYDGNVFVV